MPEALVRPRTAEEIAAIMKLANRERIPVTPRGAGSGLSGGAVPIYGGIVLLCDRMNRILEIDRENMIVVVEPGVVTNEINDAVRRARPVLRRLPDEPGDVLHRRQRGRERRRRQGRQVRRHRPLRHRAWRSSRPPARSSQLGGKLVKDVTGYNLIHLMVGSEGTLGIFTKITLKLLPLPKANVDLLCLFQTAEDAIAAVPKIMTTGGIIPTAIEFMDRQAVQAACQYLNETIPYQQAGAMLLITVDGADAEQVEREYEAIGELCLEAGAIEVYVADNSTTSERIWKVRRNIAEAFTVVSPHQSQRGHRRAHRRHPAAGRRHGGALAQVRRAPSPAYGHAGDGNLHTRARQEPRLAAGASGTRSCRQILDELYKLTADLGGRISRRARHRPQAQEVHADLRLERIPRHDPRHQTRPGPEQRPEPGEDLRSLAAGFRAQGTGSRTNAGCRGLRRQRGNHERLAHVRIRASAPTYPAATAAGGCATCVAPSAAATDPCVAVHIA